jgi:hypothetical protein
MALFPCPDCRNLCSTEATSCPHCGKPFTKAAVQESSRQNDSDKRTAEHDLYTYISDHSVRIIGVCLTLLGLFKTVEGLKGISSIGDELLALDAIAFLTAGTLAFRAMRLTPTKKLERAAHVTFLGAAGLLALICALILVEVV